MSAEEASPLPPVEGTLADLLVWDRLEVGPVQVEARRIRASYRVVRGEKSVETEFSYRFDEDVFDPSEPASRNLASMLTAQVALNYGLFTRALVFRGTFDLADRRFLKEMAQNTAREIYVKKFLEPNPYLTGPAANLRLEQPESYLQATLLFEGDEDPGTVPAWEVTPDRHLVLSSGGKDSLLTYGLLRELSKEAHPVFVNESGGHWLTAKNAYTAFEDKVPGTTRVWTNADRVFTWALRQLPFIREDFQRVRGDDYPIRLWTVGVFLFGALPLARSRGLGRLLVGDEYDTTRRQKTRGISNYDGLYDQSRFFDRALSKYFERKGWGVHVLSLLRPLSELLIQRLLAERYPDLHRHQVSCHSAHKADDRIKPCGNCEKCRRIVGVHRAQKLDLAPLGYTDEMIQRGLAALGSHGVHQAAADAQHLLYLLVQGGHLSVSDADLPAIRPRPEVEKLRLDDDRSPLVEIPDDLRRPLLEIYLAHAAGAVKRQGRVWVDTDPLGDAEEPMRQASPSAPSEPRPTTQVEPRTPANPHLLAELTWPQAAKRFRETEVAILPVGAIEQHGPHLPLDVDAWDADYLARRVALACEDPKPLVMPLIPYGVSYHHDAFPGTISVSPNTLSDMIYDIGMSAARHGITRLVILNGHGGNGPALHHAAQRINRDARILTMVDTGETSDHDIDAMAETPNDVHAGEIETSTTLAVRPELVDMEAAFAHIPQFGNEYLEFSSVRSVDWYVRTEKISPSGVLGDPTKATVEKGEKMWEIMTLHLVNLVNGLKNLRVDEFHQRRY